MPQPITPLPAAKALAEDLPALFDDDEEWRAPAEATIAEAMAAYWSEIETIDRLTSRSPELIGSQWRHTS